MPAKDPRVDQYIDRAAPFARPILKRLRKVIHAACPEVEETLKWGFPHFMHHGILCSMAAFKAHCAFGFWQEKLLAAKHPAFRDPSREAMGQFGRLESLDDLPADRTLVGYVRAAAEFNASGVRRPAARRRGPARPIVVPPDFREALRRNPRAAATFEGFSPTQRREDVDWVGEAKRDATRRPRLDTSIRWLAEGKTHNWKYAR